MSTSRPEADTEYSRGDRASNGAARPRKARSSGPGAPRRRPARSAVTGLALVGSVLLVVAEFTPLLKVHSGAYHAGVIKTIETGAHNSYALLPVAVLAAALALSAAANRLAIASVGVLGLVALGIALLADLPDAHASGLIGHAGGSYVTATSSAGAGLYLETLGAVLLLLACGAGLLLASPPGTGRGATRA